MTSVELVGFGQLAPVQIGVIRRDFADHEADPVDVGVTEQRVGVRLQRALRHRGAVPVMLEVLVYIRIVDHPAGCGDVALLDRQHGVVVERLAESLDQHGVRGQPCTSDAHARLSDEVLDVVRDAAEPLRLPESS